MKLTLRFIVFAILIFSFCLTSCKSKKDVKPTANPTSTPPVVVDIYLAQKQSIANKIECNGTVVANEMVEIKPEISGRLTYINLTDGKQVTAGEILAKINDADLQAQLNKTKVQLAMANKTEERLKKLLQVQGVNVADYDNALNTVNSLKADIEIIKAQLDKTIIKAPFSGKLGLRQISNGAYVTPQNILTVLQQNSICKVDFAVPENYASLFKNGNTVNVNIDNKTFTAKIIASEPELNNTTRSLKTRAIVNNASLTPGSFATVSLNVANTNNNFVVIPTNAIIPDAKAKKVVVVNKGKGKFVEVETGTRMASGIEIIKGIHEGDSIVVTGVLFVRPNSALKVRKTFGAEILQN